MTAEHSPTRSDHQTFLFADLAGFTAMTEAHGDEQAADLVTAFCRQARALLPEYDGEEVKVIGDALMIRVPEAPDAVRLGLRLAHEIGGQHAFPGVRVGLHTGPAVQRERDWFGTSVNTAARVSAVAVAGEVLVTDATRAAAAGTLAELDFRPRGPTEFKNLSQPIEIYSVASGGEQAPRRLAVDPVCQMAVDPEYAAARRQHGGREYLFCSEACAARFDQAPARIERRRGQRGQLRASDEARERASSLLRRAYERGRLELEELEDRAAHVQAARTREELRVVLRDLPEYRRWRRRVRRRRMWAWLTPWRWRRRAS